MKTVKINGVPYPVAYNMGALDGILSDSDGISLEDVFAKVVSITQGGVGITRKDLNEANRLSMICVYNGIKNACEVNNTPCPWPTYSNFAAHLKPSRSHQTEMGKCLGLFVEAFNAMDTDDDEEKKEVAESGNP